MDDAGMAIFCRNPTIKKFEAIHQTRAMKGAEWMARV
jgi:hypothetical protein